MKIVRLIERCLGSKQGSWASDPVTLAAWFTALEDRVTACEAVYARGLGQP